MEHAHVFLFVQLLRCYFGESVYFEKAYPINQKVMLLLLPADQGFNLSLQISPYFWGTLLEDHYLKFGLLVCLFSELGVISPLGGLGEEALAALLHGLSRSPLVLLNEVDCMKVCLLSVVERVDFMMVDVVLDALGELPSFIIVVHQSLGID